MTHNNYWKVILAVMLGLLFTISCATNNPDDPYETYNHHMYAFNKTIDKVLLKPVATAYNFVLPAFVRKGVNNFFNNLDEVTVIINDLFQAEFYYATSDTWRLVVNTTVGIGGLIDVATMIDLQPHDNDLGLTFAKWGYKSSSYLILPILGPRTVRDSFGLVGDYFVFSVYPYIPNATVRYSLVGLWLIEYRAEALRFEDTINAASFDPYVFERNAYLQHRNAVIRQNNGESEDAISASNGVTLVPDETQNKSSKQKP